MGPSCFESEYGCLVIIQGNFFTMVKGDSQNRFFPFFLSLTLVLKTKKRFYRYRSIFGKYAGAVNSRFYALLIFLLDFLLLQSSLLV